MQITTKQYIEYTTRHTLEYTLIERFYRNKTVQRSGVPLINHINEGIEILFKINQAAIQPFCLHPLIQNDEDFKQNWDMLRLQRNPGRIFQTFQENLMCALEYRNIANQYLSHRVISSIDEINLSPIQIVNDMLKADKIQNYKDFILYHIDTHPRSKELDQYFKNWLKKLEITNEEFQKWFQILQQ